MLDLLVAGAIKSWWLWGPMLAVGIGLAVLELKWTKKGGNR